MLKRRRPEEPPRFHLSVELGLRERLGAKHKPRYALGFSPEQVCRHTIALLRSTQPGEDKYPQAIMK
jgi:hypothetical protein